MAWADPNSTSGYVPVTHDMYQPILDATQEQRRNRRKN